MITVAAKTATTQKYPVIDHIVQSPYNLVHPMTKPTPKPVRPRLVDLRQFCSPIVDQGALNSCTANAIVSGLREFLLIKSGQPLVRLSRLFLYEEEHITEKEVGKDSGAVLKDGFDALKNIGVPPEADYPYDVKSFDKALTPQMIQDASKYKISDYQHVPDLETLKDTIAEGYPVVFGFKVYPSFELMNVHGLKVAPLPDHAKEHCMGGHAVMAVGYDDDKEYVIVRNSYGEHFADSGYFYMPYTYWTNLLVLGDMWTSRG